MGDKWSGAGHTRGMMRDLDSRTMSVYGATDIHSELCFDPSPRSFATSAIQTESHFIGLYRNAFSRRT